LRDGDVLILRGHEIASLLAGHERELIGVVRDAYAAHAVGESSLPHSTFLRFPGDQKNRIIALPAFLGREFGVAGIKWVASFPGNLDKGLDRASAVTILNSRQTGRPQAIIEGSIISAKRTAASAALAASVLQNGSEAASSVGLIGCGLINFETVRFLLAASPGPKTLFVFDTEMGHALRFADLCRKTFDGIKVEVAPDAKTVLENAPLISLATTATVPHIFDLSSCAKGSIILHVSLRDLSPEVILACENIVDDIDHVCRAQTSIHLAEQLAGNRDFIKCTLADLLQQGPKREHADAVKVFSPFGLGVLDIAVGKFVLDLALKGELGTLIQSFLPDPWLELNSRPS
jgi:N-[(2S)-2-amino-2-carboxyethyl]-L-glutamate dehydrogenase